jgi:hypothetical protein
MNTSQLMKGNFSKMPDKLVDNGAEISHPSQVKLSKTRLSLF